MTDPIPPDEPAPASQPGRSAGPPPDHDGTEQPPRSASRADEPPRSGLRDPRAAARVLGTLTLLVEAMVLLLAIAPLRMLGGPRTGLAITSVVLLAVLAVGLTALLRYEATWYLAGVLHLAVTLAGFFQWSLGVLGVVFALAWWYVLRVRRTLLGPGRQGPRTSPGRPPA